MRRFYLFVGRGMPELTNFSKRGVIPKRIEHWIEAKQGRSDGHVFRQRTGIWH